MTKLERMPDTRDLIKHEIEARKAGSRPHFVGVFEYPDCIREFDGREWIVYPKATKGK